MSRSTYASGAWHLTISEVPVYFVGMLSDFNFAASQPLGVQRPAAAVYVCGMIFSLSRLRFKELCSNQIEASLL